MLHLNKSVNLQDVFLNLVRKEKIIVTLYLTNGFQIKGTIKGFDNFVIIVENDGKEQLIYKHAVSTIAPSKNINISVFDKNNIEQE